MKVSAHCLELERWISNRRKIHLDTRTLERSLHVARQYERALAYRQQAEAEKKQQSMIIGVLTLIIVFFVARSLR